MGTLIFWLIVIYILYRVAKAMLKPASNSGDEDPLDSPRWDSDVEYVPSTPRPVNARLKLKYRDVKGAATERIVQANECDTSNPQGYLIGFCEMRQAVRTFRLDRIAQAIDMETGEIIPNILAWAEVSYKSSPAYAVIQLLDNAADALRGLFYIGKADGRFTKKEKELFLAFCHKVSGDERITLKQIEEACTYLPMPSMQAYKLICGRLAKEVGADIRESILVTAEAMIATEKKVSPEEAEALSYMKKRFEAA